MKIYRILFLIPLLGLGACSTIKLDTQGQSQAAYSFGTFKMIFNGTSNEVTQATLKGLDFLNLHPTSVDQKKFTSKIKARAPKDKKISIEIYEMNSVQTMIEIRWGAMGDKDASLLLYNAIEANMPHR